MLGFYFGHCNILITYKYQTKTNHTIKRYPNLIPSQINWIDIIIRTREVHIVLFTFITVGDAGCSRILYTCGSITIYHLKIYCQMSSFNKRISQMRGPLAACRDLARDQNKPLKVPYVFEHKIWYIVIHAPYIRVVHCHISNISQRISRNQIC